MPGEKLYQPAPSEVTKLVACVMADHHPELVQAGVKIDTLLVLPPLDNDGNPTEQAAIVRNGQKCEAMIKIEKPIYTSRGVADATLLLDDENYRLLSAAERLALIDHELYHLECDYDSDGELKRHANMRPKLKIRKHDVEIGVFFEVANRHGEHTAEYRQVRSGLGGQQWVQMALLLPVAVEAEVTADD